MSNADQKYVPSAGAVSGFVGVALLTAASWLVGNSDESELVPLLACASGATGLYCLLAGAIARGLQLARGDGATRAEDHADT